jgi:hypothetical protein
MFKPLFRLMLGSTLIFGLTGCPDNDGDDDNDRDFSQQSDRYERDQDDD